MSSGQRCMFLSVLLLFSFFFVFSKRAPEEEGEFGYFVLALQWPGTICQRTQHCCPSNGCCRKYILISFGLFCASFLLLLYIFLWVDLISADLDETMSWTSHDSLNWVDFIWPIRFCYFVLFFYFNDMGLFDSIRLVECIVPLFIVLITPWYGSISFSSIDVSLQRPDW